MSGPGKAYPYFSGSVPPPGSLISLGLDTLQDLVTGASAGAEATGVGGAALTGVLGAGAGAGVFTGAVWGGYLEHFC